VEKRTKINRPFQSTAIIAANSEPLSERKKPGRPQFAFRTPFA
jgi:hypothetical protein